ncbi:DDE-type integrase/transposase/recombinase [Streptomyces sp. TRM68367]|uniref:DDE-type integrase/transposase/recombinase n=1 Tax=Streptomyces sp. TRM68367 TaxID=2758415 RepID=UPI00165B6075|nr:DDE-type integrase/transposase/recombinase [Streptomyces sp. TRM68367]
MCPPAEGWLYLACWLDLATREVVGYAMADHHRAELVVDALDMAHGRAGLEPGCVIHSDRGSEYTSTQFRDRLRESALRQSCGRTGSCFDNAAAESFWALLKEEIGARIWPDRATARTEVFVFIERPCCPIDLMLRGRGRPVAKYGCKRVGFRSTRHRGGSG